jgi:hypothetical protein
MKLLVHKKAHSKEPEQNLFVVCGLNVVCGFFGKEKIGIWSVWALWAVGNARARSKDNIYG